MKTRFVVVAGAVAAVAAAGPASAIVATPTLSLTQQKAAGGNGSTSGIHDTRRSERQYCSGGSTATSRWIEYQGPTSIWPPNHKMRNYKIIAHDDDAQTTSLMTVTTSSQVANGTGDGNTDVDMVDTTPVGADMGTNEATNEGQVRGERSGNDKAGRTYTFDSTATFDGETCQKQFTAHVPHDQRDQANAGSGKTPKKSARRGARRR